LDGVLWYDVSDEWIDIDIGKKISITQSNFLLMIIHQILLIVTIFWVTIFWVTIFGGNWWVMRGT
jgi:hypothetical protein